MKLEQDKDCKKLIELSNQYNFDFDLQKIEVIYKNYSVSLSDGEYYDLIVYVNSDILKFQSLMLCEIIEELEEKLINTNYEKVI